MNYLPGRPYALLKDSVVFQIVYTGSDEDVNHTLSRFTYDEAVDCSLYERELFVGEIKLPNGVIVPPKPYPSWVFNEQSSKWEAPIPLHISDKDSSQYTWDEGGMRWQLCTTCNIVGINK